MPTPCSNYINSIRRSRFTSQFLVDSNYIDRIRRSRFTSSIQSQWTIRKLQPENSIYVLSLVLTRRARYQSKFQLIDQTITGKASTVPILLLPPPSIPVSCIWIWWGVRFYYIFRISNLVKSSDWDLEGSANIGSTRHLTWSRMSPWSVVLIGCTWRLQKMSKMRE